MSVCALHYQKARWKHMWQGTKSQCKSKGEKRRNALQMWRLLDMAAEPRYIAEGSSFDRVHKLKSFSCLMSPSACPIFRLPNSLVLYICRRPKQVLLSPYYDFGILRWSKNSKIDSLKTPWLRLTVPEWFNMSG